ncbi:hypothetical protein PR048_015873 [Dryococelus australis]|uniref:Uncharacterized protein n=1 Tax=Dryococelus australis TaxID=614101 RepID=A0ABQ9HIP6_9NEOP|nr:hypothetical protein PR048_015873 [Dryococelus australis]
MCSECRRKAGRYEALIGARCSKIEFSFRQVADRKTPQQFKRPACRGDETSGEIALCPQYTRPVARPLLTYECGCYMGMCQGELQAAEQRGSRVRCARKKCRHRGMAKGDSRMRGAVSYPPAPPLPPACVGPDMARLCRHKPCLHAPPPPFCTHTGLGQHPLAGPAPNRPSRRASQRPAARYLVIPLREKILSCAAGLCRGLPAPLADDALSRARAAMAVDIAAGASAEQNRPCTGCPRCRGDVVVRLLASHLCGLGLFLAGSPRNFACGNRAGRCRWPAGFLGDLSFSLPFHSGASPYSPCYTRVGSRDLDVKSRAVQEITANWIEIAESCSEVDTRVLLTVSLLKDKTQTASECGQESPPTKPSNSYPSASQSPPPPPSPPHPTPHTCRHRNQGPLGVNGVNVVDGVKWVNGVDGVDRVKCVDGVNGVNEVDGVDGVSLVI